MKRACLLIFFVTLFAGVFAQSDSLRATRKFPKCEVKLRDGTNYKGYLRLQNDSVLVLDAGSGVIIRVPKKAVSELDIADDHVHDSTGIAINSPLTLGHRYYVLTSAAFPFRKRETFASASYLVFFNFNHAFNRHFSLGISSSVIGAPMGIHGKANFEASHKVHVGFEAVAGGMMYLNPKTSGYGGVGKLTLGEEHRHFTVFAGYLNVHSWVVPRSRGRRPPRGSGHYVDYNTWFAGASAFLPLSASLSFVSEAFAFPSVSVYTASAAIRTVRRQRFSFVFGIQLIANTTTAVNRAFAFPYLGFSAGF